MTQSDKERVEEIRTQNNGRITQYFLHRDADNIDFLLSLVKRQFDELQSIKNWHTSCEEQVTADSTLIKELLERLVKSEKRAEAAIADMTGIIRNSGGLNRIEYPCDRCIKQCKNRVDWCDDFEWNDPTKEENT